MSKRSNPKYKFIGSLKIVAKKNCFTESLYQRIGDVKTYYIQKLKGDVIKKFEEISIKGAINPTKQPKESTIGDFAIYCFTTSDNDLIEGTRQELEPKLLNLLFGHALTPGTSLILSSFLQLHGKTAELLESVNKHLKEVSVAVSLRKYDFIETSQSSPESRNKTLSQLFSKFERLRKIVPEIILDDVALFEKKIIYFGKHRFDIHHFLSIETNLNFPICNRLITTSKKLYLHLLTSGEIMDQHRIENIMSPSLAEAGDEGDQTVLEIGFRIEMQLSQPTLNSKNKGDRSKTKLDTKAIAELMVVAKKITKESYAS